MWRWKSEKKEIGGGLDHNKLQAENYLQIFHNTLVLLSRIEATGMQKKEAEP